MILPLLTAASLLAQEPAPGALRPWTVLVYGGADNDADGPILEFLDQGSSCSTAGSTRRTTRTA